jgi:hypothetical protein
MAKCFNPTCSCKHLELVREIILRCNNCNCGVKVESENLRGLPDPTLLFTILKNAE